MLQAIVGGVLKGTKLQSLSGQSVRPTAARVREAVFNILRDKLAGRRFADVFAGNGGMGIEAISRGAAHVTFIEKDSKAAKVIKANLDHCQSRYSGSSFADQRPWPSTDVETRDAFRLSALNSHGYDIVWLDPPYQLFADRSLDILRLASALVAPGGLVLIESDGPGAEALSRLLAPADEEPATADQDATVVAQEWDDDSFKQRRYGKTIITSLQRRRSDV